MWWGVAGIVGVDILQTSTDSPGGGGTEAKKRTRASSKKEGREEEKEGGREREREREREEERNPETDGAHSTKIEL